MRASSVRSLLVAFGLVWVGCGSPPEPSGDASVPVDARTVDARVGTDAQVEDGGDEDGGDEDGGADDAGESDAGEDAEVPDAQVELPDAQVELPDAGADGGIETPDAGADGGIETPDAGADGGTETPDAGPSCGDGMLGGTEDCDGTDLGGETCTSMGFGGGTLACTSTCTLDTSGCNPCGNGMLDPGEACDGTALGSATCAGAGFDGGTLSCSATCTLVTTACFDCGDGTVNGTEQCDGAALGGATCSSRGFAGGTLGCSGTCTFDTSMCTTCGNGTLDPGEVCDGTALGGATCGGAGFDGGTLGCTTTCTLDTSMCTDCGDGAIEGMEQCDGAALGGATCSSRPGGFTGGTLGCDATCLFDTAGCTTCGDGVAQGAEACDGTDLRGETCATRPGFASGTLACTSCGFDTSGCSAAPAPSAAGQIVISEIMNDPTALGDTVGEWFEVVNTTAGSLNLSGCRFTGTGGTGDTFVVGTNVIVAPGGYATFAASTMVAFAPSYVWTGGFALANASDGISLECGSTAIDLVAYDGGVSFPDPTGASLSLSPSSLDATSNDVGFRWCVATSPLGTSADRGTPGAANDACETFTIGFCRLQHPGTIAGEAAASTTVYGRVYAAGLTDRSVATDTHPQLVAEVGFGPDGSDPTMAGWTWMRASANAGYNDTTSTYEPNNDEYEAALVHPAAGSYDYAYRFSGNRGETWVVCDTGAGSSDGYQSSAAGQMTTTAPVVTAAPWINEIHYDDASGDAGEGAEIAAAAGTAMTGYSLVYYNGNGGSSYHTTALTGTVPDQQNGFGTLWFAVPATPGVQNGAPDGVALVGPLGVVQFLCYEGTFTATNGPANGTSCVDIGVLEVGTEPDGQALQLTGAGTSYSSFTWGGPVAATPGAINAGQSFP